MSFVKVAPGMVTSAAGDLDGIRSALSEANVAAAPPTTLVAAPGMDQVSAAITAALGTYAQEYQAVSAQVAEFHDTFVGALNSGSSQYLSTEAANAEQNLLNAVNAPAKELLGHPLTGTGAAGAEAGTGSPAVTGGGGSIPAADTGETQPLSIPVVNADTSFGPVELTPNGTVDLTTATLAVTSGTLLVPSEVSLGVDAIGPLLTTATALQNSSTAISNALDSGHPAAAVNALFHTPASAVKGLLYGQQTISESITAPADSGYASTGVNVPVGGLLAPLEPLSTTPTPTGGTPTVIPLSGTEFGGLIPALQDEGALPRL